MTPYNHEISEKLREIAFLLKAQHANPFRYRAYLNAANTLESLPENVDQRVLAKGINGLTELPTIGTGIAQSIYEYVATARMTRLQNLQGESDPLHLLQSIPTIGNVLALRIYDTLHINTLEALENAAYHELLDQVEGLGRKRKAAIQAWLLKHLGEHRQPFRQTPLSLPRISLLLKVDSEYRSKADNGKLPLITPKRFNPENRAWLPILHTTHEHWHFTALYSNSQRAHKLKRVFDWVVIYFYDIQHQEGQHTVVTETHGPLLDKRVVRGREAESYAYYQSTGQV